MIKIALIIVTALVLVGCEREFHPDRFDGGYGFVPESTYTKKEIELGRSLFFDKILSGNKNISCATCHHPSVASADGVALGFGEGGSGVGPDRTAGKGGSRAHHLLPRNSPALFNLGSEKITALFHDGRIEESPNFPNGVFSPEGKNLPAGLKSKLAVQAMFPVTSREEMAGFAGENSFAKSAMKGRRAEAWNALLDRVRFTAGYVVQFNQVYGVSQNSLRFIDIANALGAFMDVEFRSTNSPFDQYINGDKKALTDSQKEGMDLFYGKAQCSSCHSGVFQTDSSYYSIGLPQVGLGKRGKGVVKKTLSDLGRELVTKNPKDRYKFRTPSLRNVELTGPYGHAGVYRTLEDIVNHHIEPEKMMADFDCENDVSLPVYGVGKPLYSTNVNGKSPRRDTRSCWVMNNAKERKAILDSHELPDLDLTKGDSEAIVEFLKSLTDDTMRDRLSQVPESVLSGLPVSD